MSEKNNKATISAMDCIVWAAWIIAAGCLVFGGWVLWPFELLFSDDPASDDPAKKTEFLRNIALGIIAALGFPLLLQRTRAQDKQADATTKQADIDSHRLLADRYARAAELFASAELSARLAGLYALWDLAKDETKIYHVRIMEILCAFVRNLPPLENWQPSKGEIIKDQRPDFEAVLRLITTRNEYQRTQERAAGYRLDFRGGNFGFMDLSMTDWGGAIFDMATLRRTRFNTIDLREARFTESILDGTDFSFADLRGASFVTSKFNDETKFENAAINGIFVVLRSKLSPSKCLNGGVVLTDEFGKDLPPNFSLPDSGKDYRRMTLREWEEKRGKKEKA